LLAHGDVLQRVGAALTRQTPPDSHLWIVTALQ